MKKYKFAKKYSLYDVLSETEKDTVADVLFSIILISATFVVSTAGWFILSEKMLVPIENTIKQILDGIMIISAVLDACFILFMVAGCIHYCIHLFRVRNLPVTKDELEAAGIQTAEEYIKAVIWHTGTGIFVKRLAEDEQIESVAETFCDLYAETLTEETAEKLFDMYGKDLDSAGLSAVSRILMFICESERDGEEKKEHE